MVIIYGYIQKKTALEYNNKFSRVILCKEATAIAAVACI